MQPGKKREKRWLTCGEANEDVKTEEKMELCFSHRLLSEVLLDILVLLRGGVHHGHAGYVYQRSPLPVYIESEMMQEKKY